MNLLIETVSILSAGELLNPLYHFTRNFTKINLCSSAIRHSIRLYTPFQKEVLQYFAMLHICQPNYIQSQQSLYHHYIYHTHRIQCTGGK